VTHFLFFQKLALQHVFKKEEVEGALRRLHVSSSHAQKILPQVSQSLPPPPGGHLRLFGQEKNPNFYVTPPWNKTSHT
jgi:hypothetical protein